MSKNALQSFNIPVNDFERARKFYSNLLNFEMQVMEFSGTKLGLFPSEFENGGVGGAILKDANSSPSQNGTLVYLNAGDNLQEALNKLEKIREGKILVEKSALGPNMGYFAIILDSEGNRVGLYSPK